MFFSARFSAISLIDDFAFEEEPYNHLNRLQKYPERPVSDIYAYSSSTSITISIFKMCTKMFIDTEAFQTLMKESTLAYS